MKKTYITLPTFRNTQSLSGSLTSLILNIKDVIGNETISKVIFDDQINRIHVQAATKIKELIQVPAMTLKSVGGITELSLSPLYPVKAIDLCNSLKHLQECISFTHKHYPAVKILRLNITDLGFELILDREIDLSVVTAPKHYSEDDFGMKIDLFDYLDGEEQREVNEANAALDLEQKEEKLLNSLSVTDEEQETVTNNISGSLQIEDEHSNTKEIEENISEDKSYDAGGLLNITEEHLDSAYTQNKSITITEHELRETVHTETLEEPNVEEIKFVEELRPDESLMIIDGNNLLHRGYFASAHGVEETSLKKDKDGNYINALGLFVQQLKRYLRTYPVTSLLVCFDNNNPFLKNFREEIYPEYKATRSEKPTALLQQVHSILDVLTQMNIPFIMDPTGLLEADDLIGSVIPKWRLHSTGPIYIISNDKDLYQLLDNNIYQVIKANNEERLYSAEDFINEYGISVNQWVDVKAILGDKSDNIPGVAGVGKKYVYDMLKEYGHIENIYENLDELGKRKEYKRYVAKFKSFSKEASLSKYLATIVRDKKIEVVHKLDLNNLVLNIDKNGKALVEQWLRI